MRVKVETFKVVCDGCGQTFHNDEDFTCYCDHPSQIENEAMESGWLRTNDGHHYCPDCHTLNDEDQWECKNGRKYDYDGDEVVEWRDIPTWFGYRASSLGEIIDVHTTEKLKQYPQKNGYVNVWLKRGENKISVPVHRLVCMAFHGEEGYINGLLVDHKDTNRANNRADNLHWVTPKENMNNPKTLSKRKKI